MISDYDGKLVLAIKGLITAVSEHGRPFGSMLKESLNIGTMIEFSEDEFDVTLEVGEVIDFYNEELGFEGNEGFDAKYEEEREHYLFLKHGLLHKIRATKYFFSEHTTSRKNILFSDDCISHIQFIERPSRLILNAHMRSSDVIRLLPVDMVGLLFTLESVIKSNSIRFGGRKAEIHLTIASAHIVKESDLERAESL